MIEAYEAGRAPAFELYGLGFEHKHVPETQVYSGLTRRPIFVPSVGNFRQGMLVSVPLHLDALGNLSVHDIVRILEMRYPGGGLVRVVPTVGDDEMVERLEPEALNNTDYLELRVFGHQTYPHAVLVARLDNLGKGASGAAVQNIGLMLDVATP
jgi:N-acetyl-gamma-glutamyl-phosphate reductase